MAAWWTILVIEPPESSCPRASAATSTSGDSGTRARMLCHSARRSPSSGRVKATARALLAQARPAPCSNIENAGQWIDWAADLHEIGLDIAHSGYHKHSGYIIENADLPGFSRQDQILLATLVRAHRRKCPLKLFRELGAPWNTVAKSMALILRLAVLLNRSRHPEPLPDIGLSLTDDRIELRFPPDWLGDHPLTVADLEQDGRYLHAAGITLIYG